MTEADLFAVGCDGVDLVDKDDCRRAPARPVEDTTQFLLRLSVVHAHHLRAVDEVERRRRRLVGDRPGDQSLPGARWTVQQDSARGLQT